MKITDDYVLFWDGIYSNWNLSYFKWLDREFNCSEQAMMYAKAMLFKDTETAEKIMKAKTPKDQKMLGREVKNFDETKWATLCVQIVSEILYHKFSQNEILKERLLTDGKGRKFVEASPYDKIWGIGMKEDDSRCLNESTWQGRNLLGKSLDIARKRIIEDQK